MLTVLFMALALCFLVRRLTVPRVNAISSASDYFVWCITVVPFITGFIAYHQWFDYTTVLILHILAGELMLIAITFTKLGHMIFFFLARCFVNREYNFGRGARTW
jgi:nitrate reductase gamma subunit